MLRIALVTNNPPPYRIPVFERIGRAPGVHFRAIFCAKREPIRKWEVPALEFEHVYLRERFIAVKGRYIHHNPDVFAALRRFAPDVVVTDGFYPTQLYAFAYAHARRVAHVPFTDGTEESERGLSRLYKAIRKFVFARSHAFLAASRGGQRLYESYRATPDSCFVSCLCANNERYANAAPVDKRFDFIFCGRMEEGKNPLFALQVAAAAARKLKRKTTLLFVGSGALDGAARAQAAALGDAVETVFHGFAGQQELPALYHSARIFLFPTLADVWGVVANEACAAGLPVIVSPHAGVAHELVCDGENGFVCALDADLWAERALRLLRHEEVWRAFSECSRALAGKYTFDQAAEEFIDCCQFAAAALQRKKGEAPLPGLRDAADPKR